MTDKETDLTLKVETSSLQQRSKNRCQITFNLFESYGRFVGKYPWFCLSLTVLFLWPVIGTIRMNVKDNIRDGYTPMNAPSRKESNVLRDFYNTTGEPRMSVVLVTAKDNGSLLRLDYLAATLSLEKYLMDSFEVRLEDNISIHYNSLCEPYCNLNRPLELFYHGLLTESESQREGNQLNPLTTLVYPIAQVSGFKIPIQRLFYGVKRKEYNTSDATITDPSVRLTNMQSVTTIMLLFRGEVSSDLADKRLTEWEMSVWRYAYEEYKSDLLQIEVIGHKILDHEMIRDGKRMTPFFAAGFTIVGIFVAAAILVPSALQGVLDSSKLWVVLVALGCPMLAIVSAFGMMTLLQMRINSFLLVMPTLVLGIGVDDGFLLIHSWLRHYHLNPRIRITAVLVDVGPSMTITTITNVLSFGIGCLTPTPEIQLFCFGTLLALATTYIFHLLLFSPVLIISDRWATKNEKLDAKEVSLHEKHPVSESATVRRFTNILSHRLFVIVTLTVLITYWVFFSYHMFKIEPRLDASKILPKNSRIQRPNTILQDKIWKEYQAVTVIVNRPFHLENTDDKAWLDKLVHEFESLPRCLGPEFTMLWTREYHEYFYKNMDIFDLIFGSNSETTSGHNENGNEEKKPLDSSKLLDFLESPFYKHWKGFIRLAPDNQTINKFWFSVAYTNVSGWGDRIDFVQTWREIAEKYPQLNVTTWEPSGNAMFVDQMLGLKKVAIQTTALTWTCMAIVCAIFIRDVKTIVIASASILSICLGVFGALSFLHFDLDPVVIAALLMSIGLSVDYTAHTTSHFQRHRANSRNTIDCINTTLDSIAWPMIQSAVSTVLCVVPLYFSFAYTTKVFFTTISLVTVFGLLHGIVVVPAVFVFIGYLQSEQLRSEKVPLSIHGEEPVEHHSSSSSSDSQSDPESQSEEGKSNDLEPIDADSASSFNSPNNDYNYLTRRGAPRNHYILPQRYFDKFI